MIELHLVIKLSLFIVYLLGLILVFKDSFLNLYGFLSLKKNLVHSKSNKTEGPITSYLSMLYYAAFGKQAKGKILLIALVFTFIISFSFSFIYFNLIISMVIAILITSIPLLSLVSKLSKDRNRSSKESIEFLNAFYRMYRMENKNIYTTMEKLIHDKNDFPVCAKYLYLLCLKLRASGSRRHIRSSCEEFALSLNSSWGKLLATCIENSCLGIDISEALLDIISQMKISKENEEKRKRLNSEAQRMTVFLVPALYITTIFVANKYLDVPITDIIYNQFHTSEGMFLFIIIVLLFFLNLIVLNMISDTKLDI